MPKRMKVTYGQLDKVLRSLGFTCRTIDLHGPARIYEYEGSDAHIILPPYPLTDRVYAHHLLARAT